MHRRTETAIFSSFFLTAIVSSPGEIITSPVASLTTVGHLAGEVKQSIAYNVSADGKVVVGYGTISFSDDSLVLEAFRWTEETGDRGTRLSWRK